MADTLRDLGVVVDHPEDNVYEVASGDVEWLFVPLEAAAKMRASFMLLGPLLTRFGRVIISNPGGDRIGRRPVDLHVEAMRTLGASIDYRNGYYFATAPGPAAWRRDPVPVRVGHGHRERDARGDPGRRPHGHPAGRAGARGGRPDRLPPGDGRRGRADPARHHRGRGPQATARCRAPGGPGPDRGRHVRHRGRGHRRPADPRGRTVRAPRPFVETMGRIGVGISCGTDTIEVDGSALRERRLPRLRRRDRALPGPGHRPPAPDRGPAHPGHRDVACPRGDLRGPPRVAGRGPPDGRHGSR